MDRPILFSAPMVRALLDGRKTQTRRVLSSDKPNSLFYEQWSDSYVLDPGNQSWRDRELRYRAGDRLYVREAWRVTKTLDHVAPRDLDRTTIPEWLATDPELYQGRKRPGMHLPRWASRLTLIVTDVRVQRLQEISNEDALAEGVDPLDWQLARYQAEFREGGIVSSTETRNYIPAFHRLWDSLNAGRGYGWDVNPWVVAITFRPILANIDQVPA
ncbi:hypothetical protein [Pseudaminobacter sp. NGMCC 1.201702]|uniref:hypothetical protein n=1 Tax=Pseudaminobacter sp. NGMCC 1.201702 TaxID=3391825 RepID=UPI0039EE34EA